MLFRFDLVAQALVIEDVHIGRRIAWPFSVVRTKRFECDGANVHLFATFSSPPVVEHVAASSPSAGVPRTASVEKDEFLLRRARSLAATFPDPDMRLSSMLLLHRSAADLRDEGDSGSVL